MGFRVLLVEPDPGLAEEICRAFGPVGFTVNAVSTGEQAVERCQKEPSDLILLAAELPDMSGFSVCNRLKRALPSVPLVVYTGEATDAAIEAHRATRTRADDYLKKPFDLAELLGRAAALLHADTPAPPPPPAPPAPPRLDGRRAPPVEGAGTDGPPVLQRVSSSQVATRGLTAAMAAAAAPPPEPPARSAPPIPPPVPTVAAPPPPPPPRPPPPERSAPPPSAPIAKLRLAGHDPTDILADWPRDPSPPKGGTPDEKVEFFRERLRARDAFLGRVRDAIAALKAEVAELAAERDGLTESLAAAQSRSTDLSHRLQEAGQDQAAQGAQLDDLRKQLHDSEVTRQSLSEVLNETMQQHEAAEQAWSGRLAGAEEARANVEAELSDARESHARAVAAIEAERADERARLEAARAEAETTAHAALSQLEGERLAEREAAAARLESAGERLAALTADRDALDAERVRLAAELAARDESMAALEAAQAEAGREAEAAAAALQARIDEADGRAQLTAGDLAEAQAQVASLEAERGQGQDRRRQLEEMLKHARAETRAHEEKALAVEHAFQAKAAELVAAEQRIHDLTGALEEGRASVEGTRGELARVESGRADAERRAAEAAARGDQLAREVENARRALEAERDRAKKLDAEAQADAQKVRELAPAAEEASRLRKEVASLREMVQQRTQAAEVASRAAQAAAAERAKVEERLSVEASRVQGAAARLEADLAATRRRLAEAEAERNARMAELGKARAEVERAQAEAARAAAAVDVRHKAATAEAGETEQRHQAEVARLKAAMVDLEKHLEARARSELAARKRVQELEKLAAAPRPPASDPADLARLKSATAKLTEEVEELKGENDFLNGEVARYVQKNKELAAQIASLKES